MSEKLSDENRALIERVLDRELRGAGLILFAGEIDRIINAARAEAAPALADGEVEGLLDDIAVEMSGVRRSHADKRGTLLFRSADALRSLAADKARLVEALAHTDNVGRSLMEERNSIAAELSTLKAQGQGGAGELAAKGELSAEAHAIQDRLVSYDLWMSEEPFWAIREVIRDIAADACIAPSTPTTGAPVPAGEMQEAVERAISLTKFAASGTAEQPVGSHEWSWNVSASAGYILSHNLTTLTALLAASPAPPSEGWRDIDSAPKDGTRVDLWDGKNENPDCRWGPMELDDDGWGNSWFGFKPTHWRPAAPPANGGA